MTAERPTFRATRGLLRGDTRIVRAPLARFWLVTRRCAQRTRVALTSVQVECATVELGTALGISLVRPPLRCLRRMTEHATGSRLDGSHAAGSSAPLSLEWRGVDGLHSIVLRPVLCRRLRPDTDPPFPPAGPIGISQMHPCVLTEQSKRRRKPHAGGRAAPRPRGDSGPTLPAARATLRLALPGSEGAKGPSRSARACSPAIVLGIICPSLRLATAQVKNEERCESGRIGLTANELTGEIRSGGSNPPLSAGVRECLRFIPTKGAASNEAAPLA